MGFQPPCEMVGVKETFGKYTEIRQGDAGKGQVRERQERANKTRTKQDSAGGECSGTKERIA